MLVFEVFEVLPKLIFYYAEDQSEYYMKLDDILNSFKLTPASYHNIINRKRTRKWLSSRGFKDAEMMQVQGKHCSLPINMLDRKSYLLILQYLATRQHVPAISTALQICNKMLFDRLDIFIWSDLNIK